MPNAEPHSVAKLSLISDYLARYFEVLNANPRIDVQRLTLIDGFCGGGSYQDGGAVVDGTPLRLITGVAEAQRKLNVGRKKPLTIDAQFYFSDADATAIDVLRAEFLRRGHLTRLGQDIHLRVAKFADVYPAIRETIMARTRRSGRSLFILDQKGYKDAPLPIVRDILSSFPGAEIILTFAVDWLINYLSDTPQSILAASHVEITPLQLREYVELKDGIGGRIAIQRLLLQHMRNASGALFASPFFIRSAVANKDLWIVHLSNRDTARNVMVETHWLHKNHSWHPGSGGLEILGFDPRLDPRTTPDFWFGEPEQAIMKEKLAEDVMRRLANSSVMQPVLVRRFVQSVSNETPARSGDFKEVFADLINRGELRLLSDSGRERRTSNVGLDDRVERPPQSSFYFMNRR